jgi:BioD-like phosphotransacetylase family protein
VADNSASIGDALIFMTKGIGAVLAAVILIGGIAGGLWWWDRWSHAAALELERALSREALNQVDLLERQTRALRVQIAGLEQALDLEQQKVEQQKITIADLGSKLNLALASRMEEVARVRAECEVQ